MRDIDFDELDKAVNRFLGKKDAPQEVMSEATENSSKEIAVKVNITKSPIQNAPILEEKSEPQAMVFSRRQVVSAGDFHSNFAKEIKSGEVLNAPEAASETPKIKVKVHDEKHELHENFDEKLHREHKSKGVDILDNLAEIKFEEPILGDEVEVPEISNLDKKVFGELKSKHEDGISAEVFEKQILEKIETLNGDSKETETFEKVEGEPIFAPESPAAPPVREAISRLVVPERPGLHQIANDEEMVIFGVKNEEKVEEAAENSEESEVTLIDLNEEDSSILNEERTDDAPEEIAIKFGEEKETEEDSIEQTIEVPQISSEPKAVSKISIQMEEVEESSKDSSESEIVSQTVSPEKISPEEIKTPFVQNVKIEKRPLGASQNSTVSNFDIKPIDRSREIKRAKLENTPSSTPILSREEYSAPVVAKKKKSGWLTVFLVMLVLTVCGAGGGFAIWYFFGQ